MLRTLIVFALLGSAAAATLRGQKARYRLDVGMNPELVARTMAQVQSEWVSQALALTECDAANATAIEETSRVNCDAAADGFASSCEKIVSAVVGGSSGNRNDVQEYMEDVCGQEVLRGTQQQLCQAFSSAVTGGMSVDVNSNREDAQTSKKICKSFFNEGYLKNYAEEEMRQKREEEEREEAEKKKAEEESEKKAEEEAKKEAQEKAAAAAQEAAEKAAEARKEAEESQKRQETKAKEAADKAAQLKAAEEEAKDALTKAQNATQHAVSLGASIPANTSAPVEEETPKNATVDQTTQGDKKTAAVENATNSSTAKSEEAMVAVKVARKCNPHTTQLCLAGGEDAAGTPQFTCTGAADGAKVAVSAVNQKYGAILCGPGKFEFSPMQCSGSRFDYHKTTVEIKSADWSGGNDCPNAGRKVAIEHAACYTISC